MIERKFELQKSYNLVDYEFAIDHMRERVSKIINKQQGDLLWLLEHDALISAGISANPEELFNYNNLPIFSSNRGGKYTFHGPGIRIGYIMIDLKNNKHINGDLKKYIFLIEQLIIDSLEELGVSATRKEHGIGIWD